MGSSNPEISRELSTWNWTGKTEKTIHAEKVWRGTQSKHLVQRNAKATGSLGKNGRST